MIIVGFLLNNKNKSELSINLCIRVNGKRFTFFTGITTPSKESFSGEQLGKNVPNYQIKNVRLRAIKNDAELLMMGLEQKGNIPLGRIKELVLEKVFKKESKNTFIDYFDEFVSLKTKKRTREIYLNTRKKIIDFDPDCTFEKIDRKWLTSFENWMLESMKINSVAINLRNIRAVFNYAIDEEYTNVYPFRKFQIKKEQTVHRCLSVEELRDLKNYDCEKWREKYFDIFMLSFYLIGINMIDLFGLTEIMDGRIEYYRAKTHKLYSIKVEPEAEEIINKYRGKEHLLSFADDYKNHHDFLGKLDSAIKIFSPKISSYWARHTWATLASRLDISKETISEALGHNIGSSITSIYISFDRNKIDEANRKVIDYLNSKI